MKMRSISVVAVLLSFSACSSEESMMQSSDISKVIVNVEDVQSGDLETRTNLTPTSSNGLSFAWDNDETVGIFPVSPTTNAQAYFKLTTSNSSGGKSAVFDGAGWELKAGNSYAGYYPFDPSMKVTDSYDKLPINMEGQTQNGNASTAHIGASYDYMYAASEIPASGTVQFTFKHIAAFAELKLTMPVAATWKKVELKANSKVFGTKGTMNASTGTMSKTATSNTFTLNLTNVSTTETNRLLTLYFATLPTETGELTITATANDNTEYQTTLASKNLKTGLIYHWAATFPNVGGDDINPEDGIPYLTFHADDTQTLQMSRDVASLEFSINNGAWSELGTKCVTFGGTNGNLKLRGKSIYGTVDSNIYFSNIYFYRDGGEVICSGDIRTLIDYESYNTVETRFARFTGLFRGCTSLIQAPELPATTLADRCYYEMFYGCTSLTLAPELPATTLADRCYYEMFANCKLLTQAPPALPATKLSQSCCERMFVGCTSLTQTPELPATTLADHCYSSMFNGCTSLTKAPALPASTLADHCYSCMFANCKLLTQAPPALPATTLTKSCCYEMFHGCTSLTKAPELPATTLAEDCYTNMFVDCRLLTTAPKLPATTLADRCYYEMFCGCTSLTQAPELPAITLAQSCYERMFYACTSLTQAPELPATTLTKSCYDHMFCACTSLITAPELPATTLTDNCYAEMFSSCISLSFVKMLATDITADNCLNYWLNKVSVGKHGTFVKNKNATWDKYGPSGIPMDWTVVYE